ncbi:putative intraflagellar transport (IFT) protein [Trypanosoma cruzi]|uniref:Intraflagellar transport (IFT) protein, putative n=3 Tax=Trypanosoma cruzi TaxID=5693 RepID=Q4DB14_TRYCC|nr:intraflagellar transport (IFT) protein, putative [Trypanosoma cruzi]PBJ80812.1 intraflagellar transport (IFT) protein [Trypanosoma cruzi cruzi]EAN89720.1 intraflagellar transport (IFT) protein, putative [Trypanosoma cruzi]KAF8286329.1 putative intraflagellar transport (IFT) protein [Trypanosoma cruzi]PWU96585.1 putative intraflagellar transport (IFT) protein [Trypanosoma cruzi]PWV15707.1 putative intraflagellar transport (IFT) protein [Trypanosoma cruzi]|eukprot:XP_811571.1 intraflagellar transport (IFT) protein [Trypanosoma cruzi strain CL Brener]
MEDDKLVMFDAHGAIRMYDPEKFDQLMKTIEVEKRFTGRMDDFRNVVNQTMSIVERLGEAIEQEKLRAIGSRNIVESEAEERFRTVQEAKVRLREKQTELDRYIAEYDSLCKVEQEQKLIIQRLSQSARD